MKKFTVITKDGSKWLRPINPFDNNDPRFTSKEPFCMLGMRPCSKTVCECDEWKKFEKNNPILPYIGSKPVGSTVDESEVREVKQWQGASGAWWNCATMLDMPNTPKRTVYTDIEPSKHEYISQSEAIDGFVKLTAQHALVFFNLIGLQTHMQCTVVDPSTGTEYEFSFIKKEKK